MEIRELLANRQVGLISAHPDDHITQVHALDIAGQVDELIYTKGRGSTLNYRRGELPPFDVAAGDRELENGRARQIIGINTAEFHDAIDGGLQDEIARLSQITADWILRKHIETLLTPGGLNDHPDHLAAGKIGLLAVQQTHQMGHNVDVLELHFNPTADSLQTEATPDGMERAFRAAAEHGSQFLLSKTVKIGWPIVPGGVFMHPDSFKDIRRYPILYDASYVYYPAGSIAISPEVEMSRTA